MRTWVVISALVILLLCGIASAEFAMPADAERRTVTGYRKGRPIRISLIEIDWAEVEVKTARAYLAMRHAAEADGIELTIRSGFRDHQLQALLYQRWRAGLGHRAARPGHSNHQAGRALDLVVHDPAVLAWLDRHARSFGFRRTVRKEPWHWEHGPIPRQARASKRTRR